MIALLAGAALAGATQVRVEAGSYTPLFPAPGGATSVTVDAFLLDRVPVTNAEFLAFVLARPEWRRDRVSTLFADGGYLARWVGPTDLGSAGPAQPVTGVSWFAARAFCQARGADLPTTDQWERAAQASATSPDGHDDPAWEAAILQWYATPTPEVLPDVGLGAPNVWGAQDLNGLVWEWVLDFNSSLVGDDDRTASDDRLQFCGAGGRSTGDARDYAAFMRLAFRSSLEARYTTRSLGFRCASSLEAPP